MKILFWCSVLFLLPKLSSQSQNITATTPSIPPAKTVRDSTLRVTPALYPRILQDLTKGWHAQQQNQILTQQNSLLKGEVKSLNIVLSGQRITMAKAQIQRDTLISERAQLTLQLSQAKTRRKRSSGERWILRGLVAALGYYVVRSR